MTRWFVLLACLLCAPNAHAQSAHTLHDDGSATFRWTAPDAQRVFLVMEGGDRLPMTRSAGGVWQVMTQPFAPDIYAYWFEVDGETQASGELPIVTGGSMGLLHVPGPDSLAWERGDAPRGTLRTHRFTSVLTGEERALVVFEPPGYDAAVAYPVLYLLHGVLNDERSWTVAGRADVVLENLIARGSAVPMLVVMPLSYGFRDPWTRTPGLLTGQVPARAALDSFRISLVDEIVPLVERTYRIATGRAQRAIAGLSMGGAEALHIGLRHPDLFGSIGSFSGAFVMYGGRLDEVLGAPDPARPPELLFIEVGARDFLLSINRVTREWLESRGLNARYAEVPGSHEWPVFRRSLVRFLTLVFQRAP